MPLLGGLYPLGCECAVAGYVILSVCERVTPSGCENPAAWWVTLHVCESRVGNLCAACLLHMGVLFCHVVVVVAERERKGGGGGGGGY